MTQTILERAAVLRKHYQDGCAYATTDALRLMLSLLVEAKQEAVRPARERRFEREIALYQLLL
jgi:hypothetical protein